MSKHKKEDESGHEGTSSGHKTYETYYDDERGSRRAWSFNPAEAVCGVLGGLRDSVLKTLPVEVTEHLVNSEKELIKAGIALAEKQVRNADSTLNRARDLNKKEEEEETA